MNPYSIVILSYNHPDLTTQCVESVLNISPSSEIHLVHNGSTAKHISLLKNRFPNITHCILEQNTGYSGGANFALNEIFKKYDTALFLTNDTELIQLPNIKPDGFCSVRSYKRKTDQIDSVGGFVNTKYGKLFHKKIENQIADSDQISTYTPGTAFWITKDIFEKVGGFDESFHTYWEDVDFSYRAKILNIQIQHSNDTIIKHKIGKTCHKHDFYTYYLYQRNRKKFMKKHRLTNLFFWISFYKDLLKNYKFRFLTTWKIIND